MRAPAFFAMLLKEMPLGAVVSFSDGTPRPPERHKRKLRDWERNNGTGELVEVLAKRTDKEWDADTFTLQTYTSDVLTVNRPVNVPTSPLEYEIVKRAEPGTILAYRASEGRITVTHIWPTQQAALAWARRRSYDLRRYGNDHWRVADDGAILPWDAAEAYDHE